MRNPARRSPPTIRRVWKVRVPTGALTLRARWPSTGDRWRPIFGVNDQAQDPRVAGHVGDGTNISGVAPAVRHRSHSGVTTPERASGCSGGGPGRGAQRRQRGAPGNDLVQQRGQRGGVVAVRLEGRWSGSRTRSAATARPAGARRPSAAPRRSAAAARLPGRRRRRRGDQSGRLVVPLRVQANRCRWRNGRHRHLGGRDGAALHRCTALYTAAEPGPWRVRLRRWVVSCRCVGLASADGARSGYRQGPAP
jgi:hypothetical protein